MTSSCLLLASLFIFYAMDLFFAYEIFNLLFQLAATFIHGDARCKG